MPTLPKRPSLSLLALHLFLLLTPRVGAAQAPTCTYDTCALRLTTDWWGRQSVASGRLSEEVAPVERSPRLDQLFAVSDSAAAHYGVFARRDQQADMMDWASGGLLVVGLALDLIDGRTFLSTSLEAGGIALFFFGTPIVRGEAQRELASAIWWYNRGLSGSP
jgi:hypothetical protein